MLARIVDFIKSKLLRLLAALSIILGGIAELLAILTPSIKDEQAVANIRELIEKAKAFLEQYIK